MSETNESTTRPEGVDRRVFLGMMAGGAGGAALVAIPAIVAWPSGNDAGTASAATTDPGTGDGAAAATTTTVVNAAADAEAMDAMHSKGIDQFLANIKAPITEGVGAVDLKWTMDGDVKVFELIVSEVDWEVTPGQLEKAMAYNGIVPGPTIRCVQGEKIRINVHNELEQSTAVHWHGQRVPNAMDGVPFITQPPIKPGESFVYEFTAGPFGTHMYHSHHNAAEQVARGLLGALIVTPANLADEPEHDLDYLYILNDSLGGFTINGKGFPATSAYTAKLGQRVRFRFMNEGVMVHPIHLHGLTFEVFARDGYPLPQPFLCDTLTVAPGERWDVTVIADSPGIWAFHCHILTHAESPHGMFGMVSVFVVE